MNIIPWRKQDSIPALKSDFDELFHRFWDPFNGSFANRLPATFQGGYFPALKAADDARRDFVVFARSLDPIDAAQTAMPDAFAGFLSEYLKTQTAMQAQRLPV